MILLSRPRILMLCAGLAGAALALSVWPQQPAAGPTAQAPATAQKAGGQEPGPAEASERAEHAKPFVLFGRWVIPGWVVELFRWSNFVALFGVLGYLLRKPFQSFFADRGRAIVEGLAKGRRSREEAAERLRKIETRLAGIEAEIAALRQAAMNEAQADHDRLRARARADGERLLAAAEQEIAAFSKQARAEFKSYAAGLAVRLAEQRVRARLTPDRQDALLRRYAEELR